jgi:hypothetical protein
MGSLKSLNIGLIEVLPKEGSYSTYKEFLDTYSRETPNSEGIRIANYNEAQYLLRDLGKLKIKEYIKNYYYSIVTEIVCVIDPYGIGGSRDLIIDDPEEIIKFQEGDTAYGYGNSGEQYEVERGSSQLLDWKEEESVFFLVRSI